VTPPWLPKKGDKSNFWLFIGLIPFLLAGLYWTYPLFAGSKIIPHALYLWVLFWNNSPSVGLACLKPRRHKQRFRSSEDVEEAMSARSALIVVCLALVSAGQLANASAAQNKGGQKPRINHRYHWEFSAKHNKTGKTVEFKYRIADGVIHDIDTDAVIGKSEGTKKDHAHTTFYKNSPFPGEFDIRFNGGSKWAGTMTDADGVWRIKLISHEKVR
jgi:hypothetical protein